MESEILTVTRETADTVTLRIAAAFAFVPGQFVMLGARIADKEVKRSYSVASIPNGKWLDVTIKKQDQGLFSTIAQGFRQGEQINLYGPFGRNFLFKPDAAEHLVFIAGGSGICPFRSFLQQAVARNHRGKLSLLYSVKTSQEVIYKAQFKAWTDKLDLDLVITLTRPTEEDSQTWRGKFGRITPKLLKEILGQDLSRMHFYICGPTAMVIDCQSLLASLGVQIQHIQTEKFGLQQS